MPGRSHGVVAAHLTFLARLLRTPPMAATWVVLADQAREQNTRHEGYLAEVLTRQVADREANGCAIRTGGVHFPAVKTLEGCSGDHQPESRREVLVHLASGALVGRADDPVLLGPPGGGKTHPGIALGNTAVHHAGYPGLADTAGWLARWEGQLATEIKRPRKDWLLTIDEVGYIPLGQDAAKLFFQVIAAGTRADR